MALALRDAFESVEHAQRDQFGGGEFLLAMVGHCVLPLLLEAVVDEDKESGDKIEDGHRLVLALVNGVVTLILPAGRCLPQKPPKTALKLAQLVINAAWLA